jgi:hypothetical protein
MSRCDGDEAAWTAFSQSQGFLRPDRDPLLSPIRTLIFRSPPIITVDEIYVDVYAYLSPSYQSDINSFSIHLGDFLDDSWNPTSPLQYYVRDTDSVTYPQCS